MKPFWQGWQSVLDPHAVQADALAGLIVGIVVVCAVVWALVVAVLLGALARRRQPPEPGHEMRLVAATERRMTAAVAAAMVATLVVVVALTAVSFVATRRITGAGDDTGALVVKVRAWQ